MQIGPGAPAHLTSRSEDGRSWPALVWAPGGGWRMISSAVEGGGIGERCWWLNTQVDRAYGRMDPQQHVLEIAAELGLAGPGVGLLTAAEVQHATAAEDGGVRAVATVGLGLPVPAAAPDDVIASEAPAAYVTGPYVPPVYLPGTINVLVVVPVPLSDAALVNLVITVTEAKTQALFEAGVPGTGTSSDAVCLACPVATTDGAPEPFGGPRSPWGARSARAVHRAVAEGTAGWLDRHRPADGAASGAAGRPDQWR
jgi:adenosylcobinamide amidohydrolase